MGNSDDIELGTRLTELAGPEAGPGREVTVPLTPLPFSFSALFPDHACLFGPLQVEAGSELENCRAVFGAKAQRELSWVWKPGGGSHTL